MQSSRQAKREWLNKYRKTNSMDEATSNNPDQEFEAQLTAMEAEAASQQANDLGSADPEPLAPVQDEVNSPKEIADPADAGIPAAADLPDKTTPEVKDTKSKFAKDKERKDDSWKALEKDKAEFRAFEAEQRKAIAAEREALQAQKPAPITPERYRATAETWEANAALLEKRATAAEEAGKYEEAEKLKEEAAELNLDAKRARRSADELAKNPPQELVQSQAQLEAGRKEWYSKAQIDFPNAAKPGTPESEALKALVAENPDIAKPENASQMYWACRLVTGETAAARVPTLTKQVSDQAAKIKELEAKLNITSDTTVPQTQGDIPYEQMTYEQKEAALEREARAMQRNY